MQRRKHRPKKRSSILTFLFGAMLFGYSLWLYYSLPKVSLFAFEWRTPVGIQAGGIFPYSVIGPGWGFIIFLFCSVVSYYGGFEVD